MVDLRKGLVFSCAFVGTLAPNAVLALIPELRTFFNASTSEVLLAISFYMFFFAVFSLFTGAISDLIGRKRILLLGLVIYAFGCLLTANSDTLLVFYMSRMVQGLGFAFVQPVLVAILGDIVDRHETGKTMGWLTAATTGGIAMGPLVAGYASAIDWRLAFVFIAIMTAVLAGLIYALVRLPAVTTRKLTVHSLKMNMILALKKRCVQMLALTGFLHVLIWIGIQAFTSDRLGEAPFLASPERIGEILALAGVMSIIASRFGGGLADRIGRPCTVILGNIVMIISLLIMASHTESLIIYAILLAVFAIGSAISWAAQLTMAVEIVPSLKGTVSSIFISLGFTGGALAPIVLSPVQSSFGIGCVYLVGVGLCMIMCLTIITADKDAKIQSLA